MAYKTLLSLPVGCSAKVVGLLASGRERKRMQDLGLICGTRIKTVCRSMCGNPVAYCFRGTVIALRNDDADKIIINF